MRSLSLLAALTLGAGPAAAGGYEDLLALYKDWRAFQTPQIKDGVPDYTPAAMAAQKARLPQYQKRLASIDRAGFTVSQHVDWNLVRAEMNGLDFDHRVLRPWSRNPAFYAVLVKDQSDTPSKEGPQFAGALELWRLKMPVDLAALRAKLRAIPAILEQARSNLVEDARDLWVLGIREQKQQAALLADMAKDTEHAELLADIQNAQKAVDAFRVWLESKLPEKRGRSGVGTLNYDWYLKNVHLVPMTWRDEVTLHERELSRALAHLALEEHRDRALPPLLPAATAEEWRRRVNDAITDYVRFLREKQVVTVAGYMEPALRARIGAFTPPAELDFFGQVESREPLLLRSHQNHWFDTARMEREPHTSPIRSNPLLYNIWDNRSEGLATAMEEMMASAGLYEGRPRSHELVYVMVAQRAARGLAGLRMHSNEFTIDDARRFAHEHTPYGWLKPDGDLVWGEQGLYLQQPGYGTSYLTGKALVESLLGERARKLGTGFALQRFMDELNASGLIPVSMIRWEMTGEEDPALKP